MRKSIFATFKGADGSRGYQTGRQYFMTIEYRIPAWRRLFNGWDKEWTVIVTEPFFCPYHGWEGFRKNWEVNAELDQERL